MPIVSVNPATGQTLRTFTASSWEIVEEQLAKAARAFEGWRRTSISQRTEVLRRAADIFDAEKQQLGALATLEMGKVITAARDEVAKCALGCRYYAEHAAAFIAAEDIDGPDQQVSFDPLGAVLAVMPWNFPFWQTVRFAAPALAAGNVALLKHSSNVPQCALALEDVFRRAGAPEGVFQTLLVGSELVDRIIADPRIAAVTLTGSEAAGRSVAVAAARSLKKSVLELGGSDPFIVLATADVEKAAVAAVKARVLSNGQSCIAAKRFIVVDSLYQQFQTTFVERMRALRLGDPMDEGTDVGPLATAAIRDELARQVADSITAGATTVLGGQPGSGLFYPPTVLVNVPPGAPAACQELFGPVAALFRVQGPDQALALANDTTFGLGASLWTADRGEARRFARELQAGSVFVNDIVVSDPRFPFGGVKRSGYGRELGPQGLREFVNIKTVRMRWS